MVNRSHAIEQLLDGKGAKNVAETVRYAVETTMPQQQCHAGICSEEGLEQAIHCTHAKPGETMGVPSGVTLKGIRPGPQGKNSLGNAASLARLAPGPRDPTSIPLSLTLKTVNSRT